MNCRQAVIPRLMKTQTENSQKTRKAKTESVIAKKVSIICVQMFDSFYASFN